jgi:plastocyanin
MSDDETAAPEEAAASDAPAAPAAASDATPDAALEAAGGEAPISVALVDEAYPTRPVERPTFRSKFLMPLIVPIAVAAGIVFYVLNVSRIFLANDETLALVFASIITVLILVGGTVLAAAPSMRSGSLTLTIGGALLVLLLGGMISIGAASPKAASGPVQCTAVKSTLHIEAGAGGALRFNPSTLTVKAGCVKLVMKFDGSHTLQFTSGAAASLFPLLQSTGPTTWAGDLPPGKYPFECTIPTHASSGMVGTLTVTS